MGCLVPLLFLGGIGIWLRRCFPLQRGTWRGMRVAALICGIGFALHGLLDVSGHRMGSLWPALFLASTAINPEFQFRQSRVATTVFRILGVLFAGVGLWWFGSIANLTTPPTTATRDRLVKQIEPAANAQNFNELLGLASTGLTIAPLDWVFYYHRGVAEAALYRPRSEVQRDFAAARYLLPNWPQIYVKEGLVWLQVGEPDLAFDIWEEGMKRWPDNAPALYAQIFDLIKDDADLRDRWRQLGHIDRRCLPILLGSVNNMEFELELERLFSEDPELLSFTPAELNTFFHVWYEHGDKLRLAETLQQHPDWQKIAWRDLAHAYADYRDYRQAYETVVRFAPAPGLPDIDSRESIELLATRFKAGGGTEQEGLILARAEAERGEIDDALTILQILSTKPGASRYLYHFEGELWARKGEWQKAWQAMSKYAGL
jgi:tetratricopeptide (TPR) repeat protein